MKNLLIWCSFFALNGHPIHHVSSLSSSFKTGRRKPGSPPIDYGGGHPFELIEASRLREEEGDEGGRNLQYYDDDDTPPPPKTDFQPIRIEWAGNYLPQDEPNVAHTKFIEEYVMPSTVDFWSKALAVYPAKKLHVNPQFCQGVSREDFINGKEGVDLIISVVANVGCGDSATISAAKSCDFDDYDRPIGGFITFCYSEINLDRNGRASEWVKSSSVVAAIHEVAHILGFNELDMAYWWDKETGLPRTERDEYGYVETKQVTCINSEVRGFDLPGETTIKRGSTSTGIGYFELVTPSVLQVARNHFDCQTMTGVRIENQPSGDNACIGDHFEQRLYYNEAMSATVDHPAIPRFISPLTLAVFEDTGWYKANYSMAESMPFGHKRGCDFVDQPCIVEKGIVPDYGKEIFCNTMDRANEFHCDPTHSVIASCNMMDWTSSSTPTTIPIEFQWFDNPAHGAFQFRTDWCPTWTAYIYDCKGNDRQKIPTKSAEVFGENSRCFNTNWLRPVCLESRCNEDTRKVEIVFGESVLTCQNEGEVIDVIGITEDDAFGVICPSLLDICPNLFCPENCAGRGVCNYDLNPPQCGCFDDNDSSPNCNGLKLAVEVEYTGDPTKSLSVDPTKSPTATPTKSPTTTPTKSSSATPTKSSTVTPTKSPTPTPTKSPTANPTKSPTATPTKSPTTTPTNPPTTTPTKSQTATPSMMSSNKNSSSTPKSEPSMSPIKKKKSFLVCKAFCGLNRRKWDEKCAWSTCEGCAKCECPDCIENEKIPANALVNPPKRYCKHFCRIFTRSWSEKCRLKSCKACPECSTG